MIFIVSGGERLDRLGLFLLEHKRLRGDLIEASATVTIPKEHHRFVIGKNGEKLQELELKTATKINIPRPDDPSNQIKITGTKEGIEKSRHEILLISAEQDKRAVERINLEKVFHPFIAGAYNKVVQEIMQETGARINIPPPSINKDEIFITGEKEPVAQAGTRIRKIYEDKEKMLFNRSQQEQTGEGQSHLHALTAVDETVARKGISEACGDAGEIKDEVSQELEPEEEDRADKRNKETPSLEIAVTTTGSKTDTALLSEALLEVGSEHGEMPAASGQEAGQEERTAEVPARCRAWSHGSSAAEQPDEDFDGPGYWRRLMGVHNQMVAALQSLPNSLRTMARSMEETSSNLAESFTRSLERVVISISTPADPTVSERLMADITASIAAQAASVQGLSDAVAAQTTALQAQTAAIVALDATVRKGFQHVTATQQSVVQQIRRIAEAPPWAGSSDSNSDTAYAASPAPSASALAVASDGMRMRRYGFKIWTRETRLSQHLPPSGLKCIQAPPTDKCLVNFQTSARHLGINLDFMLSAPRTILQHLAANGIRFGRLELRAKGFEIQGSN
eukprot:g46248.t1